MSAVVIYSSLWIGPGVGLFALLSANENFGLDSNAILGYVPADFRDSGLSMLGFAPGEALQPWHTSALLAYLGADVAEVARLPATLLLAPKLKAWWDSRKGSELPEAAAAAARKETLA